MRAEYRNGPHSQQPIPLSLKRTKPRTHYSLAHSDLNSCLAIPLFFRPSASVRCVTAGVVDHRSALVKTRPALEGIEGKKEKGFCSTHTRIHFSPPSSNSFFFCASIAARARTYLEKCSNWSYQTDDP